MIKYIANKLPIESEVVGTLWVLWAQFYRETLKAQDIIYDFTFHLQPPKEKFEVAEKFSEKRLQALN